MIGVAAPRSRGLSLGTAVRPPIMVAERGLALLLCIAVSICAHLFSWAIVVDNAVGIAANLGRMFGLADGQQVSVAHVDEGKVVKATSVSVEPVTVDDWEVCGRWSVFVLVVFSCTQDFGA
jgi:hypothetical protein